MTPETGAFVVGLTGFAQHGKDSVANRLVEVHGYTRFAFADLLKSMALVLNPLIDLNQWRRIPEDEGARQLHADWKSDYARLAPLVEFATWDRAKLSKEVRRFLQVLGTEAVRDHLGQNQWVDATLLAIAESGVAKAVISDARFPNEFQACLDHGTLVKVERYAHIDRETGAAVLWDNGLGTSHPSEQFIADAPAEFTLGAVTGDMEGLLEEADLIAHTMEGRVTAP